MKKKWVTTDSLLEAVKHVKDEFPEGNARVELYIKGSGKRYGIVSMNHYHFIPNIVLLLEEIKDGKAW